MLHWINFLHIYQPPTQDPAVLKKIIEESYSHILDLFDEYPQLRVSLNISGSLLEKFQENENYEIIERFRRVISRGQIELLGSAMYHPILPLIPESEVKHQIELGREKGIEVFGDDYHPKGFYFPEMAYSKEAAKIVKEVGFEWIALDEIHFPGGLPDSSVKYEIKDVGLNVFFRSRKYSKGFPPELIVKDLSNIKDKYLITAHDGEMYGHWHKDFQGFYKQAFENPEILMITGSEYVDSLPKAQKIEPISANWESTKEELEKNIPYALWKAPDNEIQTKLWELVNWIYPILLESQDDPNYSWAKRHFDRGISSCYWWWASGRKIDAFSPVSWNPTEIEKGLDELVKSIRSLKKVVKKKKLETEQRYSDLLEMTWKSHWDRQN